MIWEAFQALFPDEDYSDVFTDDVITELLETSSVTVTVGKRQFVITVLADEVDP